jgi:hypothetical protein
VAAPAASTRSSRGRAEPRGSGRAATAPPAATAESAAPAPTAAARPPSLLLLKLKLRLKLWCQWLRRLRAASRRGRPAISTHTRQPMTTMCLQAPLVVYCCEGLRENVLCLQSRTTKGSGRRCDGGHSRGAPPLLPHCCAAAAAALSQAREPRPKSSELTIESPVYPCTSSRFVRRSCLSCCRRRRPNAPALDSRASRRSPPPLI